MKTPFLRWALGVAVLTAGHSVWAEDAASLLAQADAAYAQREDVPQAKIAMVAYERAAVAEPRQAVEYYWKAARAAWWMGENSEKRAERLEYFKRGMNNAEMALALNPDSVEAHFWLGCNEGSFGDTKGVMKSLSLVKPIRREMQEVIRLNERYSNGGAYQVLGVVDYKVPGFIGGSKIRAKQELEKALAIGPTDPFNRYYMAEFYKTIGDRKGLQAERDALRALQAAPDLAPELKMLRKKAERELK